MKAFIKKLLLFFLGTAILLFLLSKIVDAGLKKSNGYLFSQWNDIYFSRISGELLISGSSRAKVHVSPRILDSCLKLNSYNMGSSGWPFSMQYVKYHFYKKYNKKPKCIIQCVDYTTFSENITLFEYEQFLPYLNDPIIRNATTKSYVGKFDYLDLYVPMNKYLGHFGLIKEGIENFIRDSSTTPSTLYKGYNSIDDTWDNSFAEFVKKNPKGVDFEVNKNVLNSFENFIKECKNDSTKIILVFTPSFHGGNAYVNNAEHILDIYNSISTKYDVPFLNYLEDSLCYDSSYFYNSQHLNTMGSKVFTEKLALDILRLNH